MKTANEVADVSVALPVVAGAPSIVARDFPGWLPPMLVKELRQGLRTRGFIGTLISFQLLMLILTLIALSTQNALTPAARTASVALSGFFWFVVGAQLLFVTPSRALGGLQLEVDARTLDLLMLTRLTAWRVVLGKWISLLAQSTLLLVAMLPYLVVRYFTENADLVEDLGRCVTMLGASAVLTAGGLWGSGVSKLFRILMGILLVFMLTNVVGLAPMFGGRVMGSRAPFAGLFDLPIDIANAVLIAAFFLVSAVRNIAPAAENHSRFVRVLPVLSLIPVPLAEFAGAHSSAVRQLVISAVFLGVVLVFELASARRPMAVHWRDHYRRGGLARFLGRLTMPGWESAFIYGALTSGLWSVVAFAVLASASAAARDQARNAVWLALLGFAGFAFPVILPALFRRLPLPRALAYFSGLAIPALLAGLSLALAESRWNIAGFKSLMEVLPFSSFLFAINRVDWASSLPYFQGLVAMAVIFGAAALTGSYWRQLATFEARDREATQNQTP